MLFWLALGFTLAMALVPRPPAALLVAGDKTLHMAAFAALSALAAIVFPRRRVIELFAGLAALGAVIELLQMVPVLGRDAEVGDWTADCGASLAVLLLFRGVRRIAAG